MLSYLYPIPTKQLQLLMNLRYFFFFLILTTLSCRSTSKKQPLPSTITTANDLIQYSIAYHDPSDNWTKFKSKIDIKTDLWQKEGGIKKSTRTLIFDRSQSMFSMHSTRNGIELKGEINRDTCYSEPLSEIPAEDAEKFKNILGCQGITFYKDYFTYLIGLPMNLLDKDAVIDPTIMERTYKGVKYDVVKVNYKPLDKKRPWYFYFNKNNHAFELCKFTSREDENKGGEYIIYNHKKNIQNIKLSSQIVWLYNTPTLDTLAVEDMLFTKN